VAGHHPVHGGQDSPPAYLERGLVLGQRVRFWRAIGVPPGVGAGNRMLLGEGMQVDLVPAFPRKGGGYLMPDGIGGWQSKDPPYHAEKMKEANSQSGAGSANQLSGQIEREVGGWWATLDSNQ
jgi:hypothetical protein